MANLLALSSHQMAGEKNLDSAVSQKEKIQITLATRLARFRATINQKASLATPHTTLFFFLKLCYSSILCYNLFTTTNDSKISALFSYLNSYH
jgi:hypothetical protein